MKSKAAFPAAPDIEPLIRTLREQRVILDADLARIYGVPTKRLNEQVKRNRDRFPPDFMFQLMGEEARSLRSQRSAARAVEANRSQFATGSSRHRDPRSRPFAFTEHGAIMAANVLNSLRAVQMSVFVVRAFVSLRRLLASHDALSRKLAELERRVAGHDRGIKSLFDAIRELMTPPAKPKREIGFRVRPESPVANSGKGKKAFTERMAKFKAEEKALEEARSVRLPFKRSR